MAIEATLDSTLLQQGVPVERVGSHQAAPMRLRPPLSASNSLEPAPTSQFPKGCGRRLHVESLVFQVEIAADT